MTKALSVHRMSPGEWMTGSNARPTHHHAHSHFWAWQQA